VVSRLAQYSTRAVRKIRNALRASQSGKEMEIAEIVRQYDSDVIWVDDVNSPSSVRDWESIQPDLIISAAYPQIFSSRLLSVAEVDCVNFHPSALPKYRGAHPHFWTIQNGEESTGVTAHRMTTELDQGPIIAQRTFSCAGFSYSDLYGRIVEETPLLVEDVVSFYIEGGREARPQNDDEATYFRNNRTIHSRLFWDQADAHHLANMVRTEQAFFFIGREKVVVVSAEAADDNRNMTNGVSVPPGTVVDISEDGVVITAETGFLIVKAVRLYGKIRGGLKMAKITGLNIGETCS